MKVQKGCKLEGVLALPGCDIGSGSTVRNTILDNQCQIPPGTVIGGELASDRQHYPVSEGGVIVVNRKLLGQGDRYIPGVITLNPERPG